MEEVIRISNNLGALIKLILLSIAFIIVLFMLSSLIYNVFISPIVERLKNND